MGLAGCTTSTQPTPTATPTFAPKAAPAPTPGTVDQFNAIVSATEPLPAGTKAIAVQGLTAHAVGIAQLTASSDAVWGSNGLFKFTPSGVVSRNLSSVEIDHIAGSGSTVWTSDAQGSVVTEFSDAGKPLATVSLPAGFEPEDIAVLPNGVWVTGHRAGEVVRIDPTTDKIIQTVRIGKRGKRGPFGIAAGAQSLWVGAPEPGEVGRINPETGQIEAKIAATSACAGVAVDATSVWVAQCGDGKHIYRIDPTTNTVAMQINTGNETQDLATDQSGVWLVSGGNPHAGFDDSGTLLHITDAGTVDHAYNLGVGFIPAGLTIAFGAIWVSDGRHPIVDRIPLPAS